MKIIGCDLHARQQTLAMLDTTTGEVVKTTLKHEGNQVREFYSKLARPVRVGIEATGSMQWFVNLMEQLGIECLVGHPAEIRAAEPRKQKHDRRDADLLLSLLIEGRFPAIWLPTKELLDLRALLRHRHQWVCLRVKLQNALQAMALANGLRRGSSLWTQAGQQAIASLPLSPHAAYRRNELQAMYVKFETRDRRTKSASRAASSRTIRGTVVDDASWSGTDHGVSNRSVPGRSSPIWRQQRTGQLCRDNSSRTFQWRAAAARRPDQTGQSAATISLE